MAAPPRLSPLCGRGWILHRPVGIRYRPLAQSVADRRRWVAFAATMGGRRIHRLGLGALIREGTVLAGERMRSACTQCLCGTGCFRPLPVKRSQVARHMAGTPRRWPWSTIVLHIRTMATTTIRIEETLKARVAAAAERAGKTAHAFMLSAISRTVEQVELDEAFHCVADGRWTKVLTTGETVSWDEAKAWLEARSRGGVSAGALAAIGIHTRAADQPHRLALPVNPKSCYCTREYTGCSHDGASRHHRHPAHRPA